MMMEDEADPSDEELSLPSSRPEQIPPVVGAEQAGAVAAGGDDGAVGSPGEEHEAPTSPHIPELGTEEAADRVLPEEEADFGSSGKIMSFAKKAGPAGAPHLLPSEDLSLESAGVALSPTGKRESSLGDLPGTIVSPTSAAVPNLGEHRMDDVMSEASPPMTHRTEATESSFPGAHAQREESPSGSMEQQDGKPGQDPGDSTEQGIRGAGDVTSELHAERGAVSQLPSTEDTISDARQESALDELPGVIVSGQQQHQTDEVLSESSPPVTHRTGVSQISVPDSYDSKKRMAVGSTEAVPQLEMAVTDVTHGTAMQEDVPPLSGRSAHLGPAVPPFQGASTFSPTGAQIAQWPSNSSVEAPQVSSRSATSTQSYRPAPSGTEPSFPAGDVEMSALPPQTSELESEAGIRADSEVLQNTENRDPQVATSDPRPPMKEIPLEFQMLDVATGQVSEGDASIQDLAEAYRVRQRSRLYRIQELKQKLETSEVPVYHEEMKAEAMQDSAVTIGSVGVEDLQHQYRAVEEARLRAAKEEKRLHRRRQDIIHRQEQEALAEVDHREQTYLDKKRKLEEERLVRDQNRSRSIRVALSSAQERFIRSLRSREVSMKHKFGVLGVDKEKRAHLMPTKKQWKLSAALATVPHPVKVRIDTIRVVRDKLQRGHYVTIVTLLDRLGGKPLRFMGAGDFYKTRSRAVPHGGRHFDLDLLVNEYLFLLCPPERELTASLVLLFEVYECKSRLVPMDRCVAWTIFPLVNAGFQLVNGKFKAPLIRGEYDPEIKLHQELEDQYKENLDLWLGNIYFKVSRMSRYLHQDKEYALRMEYTSNLLGFEPAVGPLAKHQQVALQEVKIEGGDNNETAGIEPEVSSQEGTTGEISEISTALKQRKSAKSSGSTQSTLGVSFSRKGSKPPKDIAPSKSGKEDEEAEADAEDTDDEKKRKSDPGTAEAAKKLEVEWEKIFAAEKMKIETGDDPEDDGLTDVSDTDNESENEHWETRYRVTSRLSRKVMARTAEGATLHLHGAADPYDSGSASDSAGPELEDKVKRPKDDGRTSFIRQDSKVDSDAALTDDDGDRKKDMSEQIQTASKSAAEPGLAHKLSKLGVKEASKASTHKSITDSEQKVKDAINLFNKGKAEKDFKLDPKKPRIQIVKFDKRLSAYTQTLTGFKEDGKTYNQTLFLISEAAADLRLNNWRVWPFWGSMLVILAAIEFRMHVHYIAGFGVLTFTNRPLYKLQPGWFRWEIKYSPIATTTGVEIGMLCAGPAAVFLVWVIIAGLVWGTSKLARVDMITYRVVGILGVISCLDWQLTLLADLISMAFFNCEPGTSEDFIQNRALLKQAAEDCTAESYRLWFHFRINEGNGSIAPVFVFIAYVGMSSVMWVLLFTYFLNIHGNGRILDLYRRLTSKEGSLFMPMDVEISPAELVQVLQSTKRWRGKDGGSRQLIVTEFEVEFLGLDNDSMTDKQQLTHIGIYTVHKSSERELHRHFLRLADGALVEMVGEEMQYVVSRAVLNAVDNVVTEALQDNGKFVQRTKSAMKAASRILKQ